MATPRKSRLKCNGAEVANGDVQEKTAPSGESFARQVNMIRGDVGGLKKYPSGTDSQFISAASVLLRRSSRLLSWRQNDDNLFAAAAFSVARRRDFCRQNGTAAAAGRGGAGHLTENRGFPSSPPPLPQLLFRLSLFRSRKMWPTRFEGR